MKLVVIGGTGQTGSEVVRELLARDQEVHVLTRDPKKAKGVPEGVQAHTGDLLDPTTIRTVFRGMDGVLLVNTVSPTETHEGLMAVNGAVMGDVGRIVYLSVHHVDRAPYLPHFGSKLIVEMVIEQSGIPYTILRPNNFFQNDNWLKQALLEHHVYTQPLGRIGSARVDVRDIAEIAAIALTEDGHAGKTYSVVGPQNLTGAQCAKIWGKALGEAIAYGGDDLDAWERQSLQYMPPWLVFDFRMMFKYFHTNGFTATSEELATTTKLLGRTPRDLESFAQEMATAWTSEVSGRHG